MRATVDSAALAAALRHSIAQRSSTLPILQHALIEAEGDALRITTTDMEATSVVEVPATVEQAGRACVLDALLRNVPALGSTITLTLDAEGVVAKAGARRRARLPILPPENFPAPDPEQWQPLAIDAAQLRTAIGRMVYAAGRADVRQYLNAVHLRPGFAEASDGHRAARAPLDYAGPCLLIPAQRALALAALMDEGCAIEHVAQRMLRVRSGTRELATLLMAARFPDVDPLFDNAAKPAAALRAQRGELRNALTALFGFAKLSETGHATKFPSCQVAIVDGALTINGAHQSVFAIDSAADLRGVVPNGGGFHPGYLAGALEAMEGDDDTMVSATFSTAVVGIGHSVLLSSTDDGSAHMIAGMRI